MPLVFTRTEAIRFDFDNISGLDTNRLSTIQDNLKIVEVRLPDDRTYRTHDTGLSDILRIIEYHRVPNRYFHNGF
jgi:hypothetical protein